MPPLATATCSQRIRQFSDHFIGRRGQMLNGSIVHVHADFAKEAAIVERPDLLAERKAL